MSGEVEPLLQVPDMPFEFSHLVNYLRKLRPASIENIYYIQKLTGCKFKRYEIECLLAMEEARG